MEPTMSAADLDETFHSLMPFTRLLGITVARYEATEVCARLARDVGLCTSGGVLHGGALMALLWERGKLVARVTQSQLVLNE
jgi:1,4-dihydroxy-2-naphthoyl-CoA hydrolase